MLNVVDDIHVGNNRWKYTFIDKSEIVVLEVHDYPVHLERVSGDFTPEQVEAVTRYTALVLY